MNIFQKLSDHDLWGSKPVRGHRRRGRQARLDVLAFAADANLCWSRARSQATSNRVAESDPLPEVAVTLLERVKVLAVDDNTIEGRRSAANRGATQSARVTLEVVPDDATTLRVVDGRGTLALALRHPDDEISFSSQNPLSLTEVLNIPPPQKHRMEIFRGKRVSRVDFETQRNSMNFVTRCDSL